MAEDKAKHPFDAARTEAWHRIQGIEHFTKLGGKILEPPRNTGFSSAPKPPERDAPPEP